MNLDDLLFTVEKIDLGIRDRDTTQSCFRPLWEHPYLLDTFMEVLKAHYCKMMCLDVGFDEILRLDMKNFETACRLLAPESMTTLISLLSTAKPIPSSQEE